MRAQPERSVEQQIKGGRSRPSCVHQLTSPCVFAPQRALVFDAYFVLDLIVLGL